MGAGPGSDIRYPRLLWTLLYVDCGLCGSPLSASKPHSFSTDLCKTVPRASPSFLILLHRNIHHAYTTTYSRLPRRSTRVITEVNFAFTLLARVSQSSEPHSALLFEEIWTRRREWLLRARQLVICPGFSRRFINTRMQTRVFAGLRYQNPPINPEECKGEGNLEHRQSAGPHHEKE